MQHVYNIVISTTETEEKIFTATTCKNYENLPTDLEFGKYCM